MTSTEEKNLIHRIQNGDPDAFGALYRFHRPKIYATVSTRTGNPEDAEDLVQAAFLRAFKAMETFRGDAAFSTWLTQIALNVHATHLRKQQIRNTWKNRAKNPESDLRENLEPTRFQNPAEAWRTKKRRQLLVRCLSDLPSHFRKVLYLRYVQDHSYLEIAEILQIPEGTVKTWLHRAKRQIKKRLQTWSL